MNNLRPTSPRILSTTDFSAGCQKAFYHALALAVGQRGSITLLHIGPESREQVPWKQYPSVRDTLIKWGMMPEGTQRNEVSEKLGLGIKKAAIRDQNPRLGLIDYLAKHPTNLMVMATEGRSGLARLNKRSVAESVSQKTRNHALLLPTGCRDLVDPETGLVTVRKVLLAIDHKPNPQPAVAKLYNWLPYFGDKDIEILTLYVGEKHLAPQIDLPLHPRLHWRKRYSEGDPVKGIAKMANEEDVDVVVMTTRGARGLTGRIRGSNAEQVLRRTKRPMLVLPESR